MQSFISELRRLNVLRVAAIYAAAGCLLGRVATQILPFFDIPDRVVRMVVVAGLSQLMVTPFLRDYQADPRFAGLCARLKIPPPAEPAR